MRLLQNNDVGGNGTGMGANMGMNMAMNASQPNNNNNNNNNGFALQGGVNGSGGFATNHLLPNDDAVAGTPKAPPPRPPSSQM